MWTNANVHLESAIAYHSRAGETSASQTKDYIASPRGYFRSHYLGSKKQTTTAMEFGSVVHEEALLDAIERSYLIIPKDVLSKAGAKNGKAWDEYKAANAGRLLLKESEVDTMRCMLDAVKSHPLGRGLFEDQFAYKELTITAESTVVGQEYSGLANVVWPVRGRLDYVIPSRIKDLKTTGDLSPRGMQYRPFDLGWDVSAEYYRRLWHALTGDWVGVDFVVVETKEPFRVEVWSPRAETLRIAGEKIDAAHQGMFSDWKDFTETQDENVWQRPGFDQINGF